MEQEAKTVLHYEGEVYVRPLQRGIVLGSPGDGPYLDDLLESELEGYSLASGWKGKMRVTFEVIQ